MTNNGLMKELDANGYVVVENVLEPSDFDLVQAEYAELLARRYATWCASGAVSEHDAVPLADFVGGIVELASRPAFDLELLKQFDITLPHAPGSVITYDSPFHVGPGLLDLVTSAGLLSMLRQLLGANVTLSGNGHCRIKLPVAAGDTPITPWHRDGMSHDEASDPVPVITTWIPMDDVAEDDGCLVVVPGGHRTHPSLGWPLTDEVVEELDGLAVPLPVRKGDVVLLHKLVPHASRPNGSQRLRWSYDLRFFPSELPGDRPWFPSLPVLVNGRIGPTSADEWISMWVEVRDRFASTGELVPGRPSYAQAVARGGER